MVRRTRSERQDCLVWGRHRGPASNPSDSFLRRTESHVSGLSIADRGNHRWRIYRISSRCRLRAHAKHQFRIGDHFEGLGHRVEDPRLETADIYKVSKLKLTRRGEQLATTAPPWRGVPPPLSVYRERGHRRLAVTTYDAKCQSCIWGCAMPMEIILDQWNPGRRRYRTETFCYGPLSCPIYKSGPTRKIPGRHGMTYEEEDWVDQDATAHRGPDE